MQSTLTVKQKTISERESNLTAIGTYVDKLEERLASFAVTRRDIEAREEQCKRVEEKALVAQEEMKALQAKVDEYTSQEEELKKLLEELALERTTLQKENRKLLTEREFRIAEEEQLKQRTSTFEEEVNSLKSSLDEAKYEIERLTVDLQTSRGSNTELQQQVARVAELESELECSRSENTDVQEQCKLAQEELVKVKKQLAISLAENEGIKGEHEQLKLEIASQAKVIAENERQKREAEAKANAKAIQTEETDSETESESEDEKVEKDVVEEKKTPEPPKPTMPLKAPIPKRKVPLRGIRKKFSSMTGLHGVLTPSTKMVIAKERANRPVPKGQAPPGRTMPPSPKGGPPPRPPGNEKDRPVPPPPLPAFGRKQ